MSDKIANIVGVGNVLMGDDGIGPAAVKALARIGLPAGVELHDAGLAFSDVLGRLDPAVPLVVIDAAKTGGHAGSVFQIWLDEAWLSGGSMPMSMSLHEVDVVSALRMEAMSGREFRDVVVFSVKPERIEWGKGLSPVAIEAMDDLIRAVYRHINQMQSSPPSVIEKTDDGRTQLQQAHRGNDESDGTQNQRRDPQFPPGHYEGIHPRMRGMPHRL